MLAVGCVAAVYSWPEPKYGGLTRETLPVNLELKSQPADVIGSVRTPTEVSYAFKGTAIARTRNEVARTSNSFTVDNQNGTLDTVIYSGAPQFLEETPGNWKHIEYATTTPDAFDLQMEPSISSRFLSLFVAYAQFYPDASTVDGILVVDSCQSFATHHDDTTADLASFASDPQQVAKLQSDTCSNPNWLRIYRGIVGFDTSSIPDTDEITAATLSFYVTAKDDAAFSQSVAIDHTVPANNTSLVVADYDVSGWDSTDQASRIALTSITTSAYNDFTLNSTGLSNISKTGNTWFGIRLSSDMDNSAPSWTADNAEFTMSMSEHTGTTQDPKLVVTHSAPADPASAVPTTSINNGTLKINNGGFIVR